MSTASNGKDKNNNNGAKKNEQGDDGKKPGFFRRLFSKNKKKDKPKKIENKVAKQNKKAGFFGFFKKIFTNKSAKQEDHAEPAASSGSLASVKSNKSSKGSNNRNSTGTNVVKDGQGSASVKRNKIERSEKQPMSTARSQSVNTSSSPTTPPVSQKSTKGPSVPTTPPVSEKSMKRSSVPNVMEVTAKESSNQSSKKSRKKPKKLRDKEKNESSMKSSGSNKSPIDSLTSSFRSFGKKRAKDFKKMKTFVSKPFRQKALAKMLVRLNKRKKNRTQELKEVEDNAKPVASQRINCEDSFPHQKPAASTQSCESTQSNASRSPTKKSRVPTSKEAVKPEIKELIAEPEKKDNDVPKRIQLQENKADDSDGGDWKKKYPPVLDNNTNNGNLLMPDGRPFWHRCQKNANDAYDEDEDSDDELPMNADVLNDVYEGRIVLAEMPKIPIQLDPYGSLDDLKEQVLTFCTRNILMGNTVRTMVNMCDDESESQAKDKEKPNKQKPVEEKKPKKTPTFVEPTKLTLYDRGSPKLTTKVVELSDFRKETKVESE